MIALLLFIVFIACIAFLYNEGMWSNALRLINVVTAALLAMNFFEPLARLLEGWLPSYTHILDFLAIWVMFCAFMALFRFLTDQLSRVKVRFLAIADRIGGGVLAAWIGWVMVCFTLTTLHTAPLARNFLFGSFEATKPMVNLGFVALAPDMEWLGFTQRMSRGPFCRWTPSEFDPRGEYMLKYDTRRGELERQVRETGAIRTRNPAGG